MKRAGHDAVQKDSYMPQYSVMLTHVSKMLTRLCGFVHADSCMRAVIGCA